MRDTNLEAQRAYYAVLRRMTPEARVMQAMRLSRIDRDLTQVGIRYRHPEYTEEELRLAYLSLITEKREFDTLFPGRYVEP